MSRLVIHDPSESREDIARERALRFAALSGEEKLRRTLMLINVARKFNQGKPLKTPQGKGIILRATTMDIYNEHFLKLIKGLEENGVLYLVVGGFAVIHHGHSRTTGDLDLYLKDTPDNRQRLVNALEQIGYGMMEPLLRTPFIAGYCEIMMDDGMYADLMAALPGLKPEDFDEHYQMASIDIIEGTPVRFLHYNHLLENKKATGRPKDLLDVTELESIHKRTNP